jgi:4-amino-4-deoxy-L-arabinose transferase-like glycosyltransferase
MQKFLANIKKDSVAYALLLFGFILRLLYIFNFTKPESYLWSDAGGYDSRALQMAKNYYVAFSTYYPPFFHIFLSLIYRPLVWLGIENWRIKIAIVIFAIFYIVGFWCIYQIVKKLFSKKIALIILVILILWYPLIHLNYVIMSENLFFPLVFLGLYIIVIKPHNLANGIYAGVLWGLAVLTRPIFASALPLFVLWEIFYERKSLDK